jgi:thiamine kinase-like enzyme
MSELMGDRGILEVETLPFWTGPIKIWPLAGGVTNRNFGVQQGDGQRFAVRLGQDLPQHGVMRFNEQAAARAAAKAGISPRIFYTAPGVMISRLLPGRSLTTEEVRLPENFYRIVALIQRCHTGMAPYLTGPLLAHWVFHLNRSYAAALEQSRSPLVPELPRLQALNDALERRVGKIDLAFTHNDLVAANIFDDGVRLWLLDWDFAGFNAPLFDLANVSANNNFFPSEDAALLETYFETPATTEIFAPFRAFKCASLLREAFAGAVNAPPANDFSMAMRENLSRLEVALTELG